MMVKKLIAGLCVTASVFSSYAHAQSDTADIDLQVKRVTAKLNRSIEKMGTATSEGQWDGQYHALENFISNPSENGFSSEAVCIALNKLSGFQLESMYEIISDSKVSLASCRPALMAKVKYFQNSRKASSALADASMTIMPFVGRFEEREIDPNRAYFSMQGLARKEVMLSFDDGPSTVTTKKILEYLDRAGVKAAFFNTGQRIDKNPDLSQLVLQAGHILGSHSIWHSINMSEKYMFCDDFPYEYFLSEFIGGHMKVGQAAGYVDPFFRYPNGSHNKDFDKSVTELGLKMFGWNIDSFDYMLGPRTVDKDKNPEGMPYWMISKQTGQKTWLPGGTYKSSDYTRGTPMTHDERTRLILKNVVDAINANGQKGIILMHDIAGQSIEALPYVLKYLYDNDFKIVLLKPANRILDVKNPGFKQQFKEDQALVSEGQRYLRSTGRKIDELVYFRPVQKNDMTVNVPTSGPHVDFYDMFPELTQPVLPRTLNADRCAHQKTL